MKHQLVTFGFAAVTASFSVSAGSISECVSGLIPNTTTIASDRTLSMAYLKIIDEKMFDSIKRDATGGLKLPLENLVPVEASLSFSSFDQRRREYFQKNQFNLSYDESFLLIRREIPEVGYDAYTKCLEANAAQGGIDLWVEDYTDDFAVFAVKWSPPPMQDGSAAPTDATITATGTAPEKSTPQTFRIGAGHVRSFTFPIVEGKELVVSVDSTSGHHDTEKLAVSKAKLKLPANVKPRPDPRSLALSALLEGRTCLVQLGAVPWGRLTHACNGAKCGRIYIDDLYAVRYDDKSEIWHAYGRDSGPYPFYQQIRGPSLSKAKVNLQNVLYDVQPDGTLTTGSSPARAGHIYCEVSATDLY